MHDSPPVMLALLHTRALRTTATTIVVLGEPPLHLYDLDKIDHTLISKEDFFYKQIFEVKERFYNSRQKNALVSVKLTKINLWHVSIYALSYALSF